MKRSLFPFLVVAFLFPAASFPNERGKVVWMKFNEGVVEAGKTGRKIMIDVYTDWCGWCKKMDRDTYDNAAVASYLNKKYVAIKIDAEAPTRVLYRGKSYTEQELAASFNVTGYPSVIFLQHDGEPITVYPGYANASDFQVVLSYLADDHYKTTSFQDYAGAKR